MWVLSPLGRTMPIDAEPLSEGAIVQEFARDKPRALYYLGDANRAVKVEALTPQIRELYVSHFTTCPAAGEFSGRSRRQVEPRRMPWD